MDGGLFGLPIREQTQKGPSCIELNGKSYRELIILQFYNEQFFYKVCEN